MGKVSSKIYRFALFVTGLFAILNIAGIWVFWMTGNAFGYVTGALLLIGLIASGILAALNEEKGVRKQWIAWLICLLVHVIFFILACCLAKNDSDYTIPALFTVMVVAILITIGYFIYRNRLVMKKNPIDLTPTSVAPGRNQDAQSDTDLIQKTVQIKVDEKEDKTPVANFKPEHVKPSEPKKEEPEQEPTGIINL